MLLVISFRERSTAIGRFFRGCVMRAVDSAFYKSKEWKACRAAYIKKVNGLCERCLADGKVVPGKFVHHKIYMDAQTIRDPSLSLCFDNLECLCSDHHNREHFGEKRIERWRFENGELVTSE